MPETPGSLALDPELLKILVCPENKKPVALADAALIERLNRAIEAGRVSNRSGQKVAEKVGGGLVRSDGAWLYPVREGIPVMLIEEAIAVNEIPAA